MLTYLYKFTKGSHNPWWGRAHILVQWTENNYIHLYSDTLV